jgi:diketogulonate reductase-like aldo/keto reductase
MGGRFETDSSNDEADIAAIRSAIEHGVTHIDTAESYGNGHSEELVGQAIRGYDRSKLIIATRVSAWNQTYDGVLQACQASLKRLGTDYIDLYMPHRFPEPGIKIEDTMRALDRLVDEGAIRNIGFCNASVNRLKVAQSHTANKIVCNQIEYSLQFREAEKRGVVEYCQQNDILVVAWGPLHKGTIDQTGMLQQLADKYGKTPYQVAINWLLSQPNVVTIPKTTQVAHLEENLGAIGWELSGEDMAILTTNFPNQQYVSQRVPLTYKSDTPV